jgi:TRAP-type C4-dicarboxylate transport system substrate-binding protein
MTNRTKMMITALVIAFTLMALIPTALAADKPMKWRMAILYPRATEYAKVYLDFLEYIKVMSKGRLVVDAVFDGEGVPAPQMLGAIKSGLMEMGQPWMPLHAGEIPVGVIEAGLPGAPADYAALWGMYEKSGLKDVLREAYAQHGIYWAAEAFQPACYAILKKEIKSLEDFNNAKLRALGAYGKMMRQFGASPVSLAFGEVYTSLATGVVDGNVGSQITDFRDAKFHEVAKWFYPVPVAGYQAAPILVNMKAWNKLSDDLKAIFETACYRHAVDMRVYCLVNERAAFKEMQNAGMKVSPTPSAEEQAKWFAAGRSVWDEYAKADKYSQKAIEVMKAFIQDYQLE